MQSYVSKWHGVVVASYDLPKFLSIPMFSPIKIALIAAWAIFMVADGKTGMAILGLAIFAVLAPVVYFIKNDKEERVKRIAGPVLAVLISGLFIYWLSSLPKKNGSVSTSTSTREESADGVWDNARRP